MRSFLSKKGSTPLTFIGAITVFVMVMSSCTLRHIDEAMHSSKPKDSKEVKYRLRRNPVYSRNASENISIIKLPRI